MLWRAAGVWVGSVAPCLTEALLVKVCVCVVQPPWCVCVVCVCAHGHSAAQNHVCSLQFVIYLTPHPLTFHSPPPPSSPPPPPPQALHDFTLNRDGRLRLPLPAGIGVATFVDDVTRGEVIRAAHALQKRHKTTTTTEVQGGG